MKIDSYSFGRIVINGKTYTSDVIIYPGTVNSDWWRREGHLLQLADLEEALQAKPDVLVIGTGSFGIMHVPGETVDRITAKGIAVKVERTGKAVEVYNELQGKVTVIAALHLTC